MRRPIACFAACAALTCAMLAACGDDDVPQVGDGGAKPAIGTRDAAAAHPSEPFVVTPSQAVAGACLFRLTVGRDHLSDCTGFDKLEACARRQCDLDNCIDVCPEYMTCLQASSIACDDTCSPEDACAMCMSSITSCIVMSTCVGTFNCAEAVPGGYCDQLRACCTQQGADFAEKCSLYAEFAATASGENSCKQFFERLQTIEPDAVPCVSDASTPQP